METKKMMNVLMLALACAWAGAAQAGNVAKVVSADGLLED